MEYLKNNPEKSYVTWKAKSGNMMRAKINHTNLNNNITKNYKNNNILKIPIKDAINNVSNSRITTLTRIAIIGTDNLEIDGVGIKEFFENYGINIDKI
jgi:hypothetical protein